MLTKKANDKIEENKKIMMMVIVRPRRSFRIADPSLADAIVRNLNINVFEI